MDIINNNSSRKGKVNLLQVAQKAGVSRSTASLVLRKSPLVAFNTRKKVEAAMEELGYVYNRSAAILREGKTQIIGLLVCDIANPSISEVMVGLDCFLQKQNYFSFLANSQDSVERQSYLLQRFKEHNMDGLIFCPAINTPLTLLYELERLNMPYVQVLRRINEKKGDYVGADYAQGIELAILHLIRLNHRHIAFIGGSSKTSAGQERLESFIRIMKREHLSTDYIIPTALNVYEGAKGLDMLLERAPSVTAAICFNDLIALGVMNALHAKGYIPGQDFSVIGVDDFPIADSIWPALTTVSTRSQEVGEVAGRLLLRRIANRALPLERVTLPTRLVIRQSCGAI
ncbi:LacI family DNA-binding transcriptional regulator [Entomobacter blattae]|uniref:Maltose regulon regulatory protein MalI n=1 Tax=Entomobacter blattae TaxID=2762277 RepID=A0A7H1NUA4_9PROT|nr:LacI family DNA-binding transcriptional regulator [Entomobacter blattae]QNT79364.1 Maltose regulon regulatory protein MalI [Entomobacter blattae]